MQREGRITPGKIVLVKDLTEVCAGNELAGGLLRCKVAQPSAQQANAVRAQRSLPKLIYDAQRPGPWCCSGTEFCTKMLATD